MIQTSSATRKNRYPQLFQIVAKELGGNSNPKILSFGCSSGEEVFSIKEYIPDAELTGVDINHRAIRIAKKRAPKGSFRFFHYLEDNWTKADHYDCIFAMAVFQKSEHQDHKRKTALESFTFNKFKERLEHLNSLLKPGGLLVIEHSDFSFLDLPLSKSYSICENDILIRRKRPVLSDQNVKISHSHIYPRIFIKRSN